MDWSHAVEVKPDTPSIDWSNAVEVKSTLPDALVNSPTDTKPIDTTDTLVDQNFGSSNGTDNGTVPSTDNGQTIPTKLALDMPGNYASDKAIQDETQKRQEQSAINQTTYKDPVTGQTQLPPQEPGMQDESLAVVPFGKLGWLSNPLKQSELYDNVFQSLSTMGTHARGVDSIATLLANAENKTKEQVLASVANIPVEDKTIALVFRTQNKTTLGFINQAVDDSTLASKLQGEVNKRGDAIKSVFSNIKPIRQAYKEWEHMVNVANQEKVVYPLSSMTEDLDYLTDLYGTVPGKAARIVRQLKKAEENGGMITLGEALDIRKGLNRVIRKTSSGTEELTRLGNIKGKVDGFINSVTEGNPKLYNLIKTTTADYARTINNTKFKALIDDATTPVGAINYTKLLKLAVKNKLNSPEVSGAIKIAKIFEKKYAVDKYLSRSLSIEGSESRNTGYIGVGRVAGWIVDHLTPYNRLFDHSRFSDLAIQKEIELSINNSKGLDEFLAKVKESTKIPEEFKTGLEKQVKLLEYKPDLPPTGDVNVQPIHITTKGTAGTPDQVSKLPLKDAQDELIKNFVKDPMKAEDVSKTLDTFINSKRLDEQLKTSAARMKVGETQKNMEMLHKIFTNEANTIVKNIEKTHGIKVPPEEVDKILKIKAQQLLEECNK